MINELELGWSKIFCLTSKKKSILVEHLRKNYQQQITFIYQEQPLGLAHAIWSCKEELLKYPYFATVLPDNLLTPRNKDLFKMLEKKIKIENALAIIAVARVEASRVKNYGVIKLATQPDDQGFALVESMIEKPNSWPDEPLAIVGRYIFNTQKIFQALDAAHFSSEKELSITQVMQRVLESGDTILAYKINNQFHDIGTPELWLETNINFDAQKIL